MQEITRDELEIRKLALNNLFYFDKYILGYDLLDDKIHQDMCDFIVNTPGDVLDLEPRDHLKTTTITIGFTLWTLVRMVYLTHRLEKILINHKILKKSKQMLRGIKTHIEMNPVFRHFFGDLVGPVWKEDEIIIKGSFAGKEPNVAVGGVDNINTSSHFTIIINDDICELKDRYSEAERNATKRFYSAVQYLKDKGRNPREINIGTRWHMDDIWNHIMKKCPHVTVRIRWATVDGIPLTDPRAKPYFPNRFSLDDLKKLRDSGEGTELFETVMMQNPLMDADRMFKLDDLLKYDHNAIDYTVGVTKSYCDPALSEKQSACDTALATGTGIGGKVYLQGWDLWKVVPDVGMLNILDVCEKCNVMELKIESNQAFSIYANNVRKIKDARGLMLSVTDAPATTDKKGRIRATANFIKQNVQFRKDWETAYPRAMTQLLEFPQSDAIDAPDALSGLVNMFVSAAEPEIRVL